MKTFHALSDGIFLSFEGGKLLRIFKTSNNHRDGRRVFEAHLTPGEIKGMSLFADEVLKQPLDKKQTADDVLSIDYSTMYELFFSAYSKMNKQKLEEINNEFPCVAIDGFEKLALEQARSQLAEAAVINAHIAVDEIKDKPQKRKLKLVEVKSSGEPNGNKPSSKKLSSKAGADT